MGDTYRNPNGLSVITITLNEREDIKVLTADKDALREVKT